MNLKNLIVGAFFIVGLLLCFYRYRFYTVNPRIIFFDQQNRKALIKNNEWIKLLKDEYKKYNLKTRVFNDKCFEFWLSNKDKNTIWIELHEYHQEGCSGDPNTSPRINTFIIDKTTRIVSWYDVIQDKIVDFEQYNQ